MKILHNILKKGLLTAVSGLLILTSCKDDFPGEMDTSDKFTVLKSIKLMNAGANGNMVLEGVVDENKKMVSFPRIEPETDFSNLQFEAELSDGSKLDKDFYSVTFEEGQSEKTVVVKVVSEPRYREYLVNLRLRVPVYGADFGKPTIYDYSANPIGNPGYAAFAGLATRGSGFDGNHVLVVSRGSSGLHLLDVQDLKNNEIKPIAVNTTGMIGGTFTYNMGAQVNGRTYVASLSTSQASPLKLYFWDDPSAAPQVIADINVASLAGAGTRHGDNFSIGLDGNGNGYAFFISTGTQVIRLKIANYNEVTETSVINTQTTYGQWSSYNRIGNTENYLVTGHDKPIAVASVSGSSSYTMGASSIPVHSGDPRVIEFNGERYLLVVTVPRGGAGAPDAVMRVYNITRGRNIADAMTAFEQSDKIAVYEFAISGNTTIAPGTQSGYHVVKDAQGKDEKLMIYGASADFGFTIVEFPVNVAED